MDRTLKATLVIPCRNEERYISDVLGSLVSQDYPADNVEIFVVDGMSSDSTRNIVLERAKKHPNIRLIDNPNKLTPYAFNIGIKNSSGQVIIFMGSHTTYSKNYVSTIVKYISSGAADCVGSVAETRPASNGFMAKYIIAAMISRIGVGNSYMRTGVKEPKYVDTASCPGYGRYVFDKIGMFNERLTHSQDIEFNVRLRKNGMKILLAPEITSYYYARSDLGTFIKYNYKNGKWSILPFAYSDVLPVAFRHLVPLLFVTSLIVCLILGLFLRPFWWLFLAIVCNYGAASIGFSCMIAKDNRDIKSILVMPFIFAALHFSYGFGSFAAFLKIIFAKVLKI